MRNPVLIVSVLGSDWTQLAERTLALTRGLPFALASPDASEPDPPVETVLEMAEEHGSWLQFFDSLAQAPDSAGLPDIFNSGVPHTVIVGGAVDTERATAALERLPTAFEPCARLAIAAPGALFLDGTCPVIWAAARGIKAGFFAPDSAMLPVVLAGARIALQNAV